MVHGFLSFDPVYNPLTGLRISRMMNHQDLPVLLHNDRRGLLTIEEGRLDVLQLSRDGRREFSHTLAKTFELMWGTAPKRLLTCDMRNFLRAKMGATRTGERTRLDLHTLIQKGSHLSLLTMHVLVEPINVPEAVEWVTTAMSAAYGGE